MKVMVDHAISAWVSIGTFTKNFCFKGSISSLLQAVLVYKSFAGAALGGAMGLVKDVLEFNEDVHIMQETMLTAHARPIVTQHTITSNPSILGILCELIICIHHLLSS